MKDIQPQYQPQDKIGQHTVKRVALLPALGGVFYELFHEPTGARHIHVHTPDRDNVFSVAFKTVPGDSTGVAHILEHTALCGSRRFPVRDPFFSMIKRSMASFMNAFTASDWTMYPFCSPNEKDYYNLLDVYLDAAFFPKLSELSFLQEGWRLSLSSPESNEPSFQGVVYNEMKGAMSSPDQIFGHCLMEALYPDVTYGVNSGGDPEKITELTHADLTAFHSRHYHPSNAWFFTFGDLPLEKTLAKIQDEVLGHFTPIDPKTDVPEQPRWDAPKEQTVYYPAQAGDNLEKKSQVSVGWVTCPVTETRAVLGLTILSRVLLGTAASPLKKALIDSGLGSALSDGTGFDGEIRDTMFACGLKNTRPEDAGAIFELVMKTLEDLCEKGIDKELVRAALHQMEFGKKEITNTPFSHGLKMLLGFGGPWLHHADPLRWILFEDDLESLKKEALDGQYLEGLIRKYFLDNAHRITLTMEPDPELAARRMKKEKEKLAALTAGLTDEQRQAIEENNRELARLQEQSEDLSSLPTLEKEDISPEAYFLDATGQGGEPPVFRYVQPTRGILYLLAAARVKGLQEEDLMAVPFFSWAFSRMGTKSRDYLRLATDLAASTGGLGLAVSSHRGFGARELSGEMAVLEAKCLEQNREATMELVADLLHNLDFSNTKRLGELALEYAAGLESGVVNNGHRLAMILAARGLGRTRAFAEAWGGIHQVQWARRIAANPNSEKLEELAARLSGLPDRIFSRSGLRLALVGAEQAVDEARSGLGGIVDGLSNGGGEDNPAVDVGAAEKEGWYTSTSVSFCARVFPGARLGEPDAPLLAVAAKLLRGMYLHSEIREKGGAYGGFALSDADEGLFFLGSYRDPHIARTLDVFSRAGDFLARGDFQESDVLEAVLQVCADLDRPDAPSTAAKKSFTRTLLGVDRELRQQFKDGVRSADRKGIIALAEKYFQGKTGATAVISGREFMEQENLKMDQPLAMFAIDENQDLGQ